MQALFKNKTTLTREIYATLLDFHQEENNWKYYIFTFIFFAFFIIFIAIHISLHNYIIALTVFIIFALYLAYRFLYPNFKVQKEYQSEKIQNEITNTYYFYEKYFIVENNFGSEKIRYHKLYKAYDKDNYFYLYYDSENVFVLEKTGFEVGTATDFNTFLKSKLKNKFKDSSL